MAGITVDGVKDDGRSDIPAADASEDRTKQLELAIAVP
jgi:hypothetical protein